MKNLLNSKFLLIATLLILINSCSFFNSKQVSIPITSNPSGANIYIEGRYYGRTPTIVTLEPNKNYKAHLVKNGYGKADINLTTWYSLRNNRKKDNFRCTLDALTIILPTIGWFIPPYAIYCSDFKLKEYIAVIPNTGYNSSKNDELENVDRTLDYINSGGSNNVNVNNGNISNGSNINSNKLIPYYQREQYMGRHRSGK